MSFKSKLPPPDYILMGIALCLLGFGMVTLSSASSVLSFDRFGNNNYYFFRQVAYGLVPGLIAMYVFSRINYRLWQKFAPLGVLIGIGLLVAVLIPSIGFKVGNSRRWINFGPFLFQPAEFMKLAIIFYLASWY
ncbi:MAG: FtsW/RodA/SpoVE family cell cycle protein, partial [Acidobacteriaceae bacterium]